jgi:hypothetical protein
MADIIKGTADVPPPSTINLSDQLWAKIFPVVFAQNLKGLRNA